MKKKACGWEVEEVGGDVIVEAGGGPVEEKGLELDSEGLKRLTNRSQSGM